MNLKAFDKRRYEQTLKEQSDGANIKNLMEHGKVVLAVRWGAARSRFIVVKNKKVWLLVTNSNERNIRSEGGRGWTCMDSSEYRLLYGMLRAYLLGSVSILYEDKYWIGELKGWFLLKSIEK